MYFDFGNYLCVLRFAWRQRQWPRRRRTVAKLLLLVSLQSLVHSVFFSLDYLLFPRLWRHRVDAPVFIVGHARSGTTLMHRLLAADEARFSFFRYWETFFPALSERLLIRAAARLDRRLLGGALRRRLAAWDERTFGPWRHMHEQGLWLAEEDLFVLRAAFVPQQWALEMPLSQELDIFHIDALAPKRRRRWLHHYRECVKRQLLYRGGGVRHLSKNPLMSGWVSALIETFPDARFVVLRRDPVQCIPSTLKLLEGSWRARGWSAADCLPALQALIRISLDSYHLPAAALAAHPQTPHCVVDYRELLERPRVTLQNVCSTLGLPVSAAQREALRGLETRKRAGRRRFRYRLDDYPITARDIERELAPFYDLHRWPRTGAAEAAGDSGAEAAKRELQP